MEWRGTFCCLFFLFELVKSTSQSGKVWALYLGAESVVNVSWPIFSAGIFVLLALILSMYLIFEHLAAYNQPEEQKFLIGLILMVPVYSLESFLSLLDSSAAFNCEAIRDCYEAFALYCFERYLIACLGGEENTIQFMESQTLITSSSPLLEESYAYGVVEHPFPLNCFLRDWNLGADFYHAVKIGVVQYMILKLICALLAMILQAFGVYGEGKFEWRYGYPYLAVILNFSQTWALYCLVQFYSVIKDKLAPIKPLAKFLTFKSIVFLTWWQGVVVAFLNSMGAFKGTLAQELKTRIQDYIICIEIVDDMKYTVSHVVEPVERGIAKINKTFHEISENVKRHEERRRSSKDDNYLVPLNTWTGEFSEAHDNLLEGSVSDSGLSNGKRPPHQPKGSAFRTRAGR
ncbi:protein LAZ1 homolog 1 isoform X2 [Populus trichocarpa]|uniref:protein LAZ1 homolog 1 isoform X2 n=1 Tax=Populus trichocarpa TaxID=3694 RepID=UPI000CCD7163|nr:protein LAZ1 homolog 1 isoform X2 [Populus trichocarpa]|eukprot:XP_024456107.1 protein LAZ1 homolog 1 isoform X3 [Populus trichocarpa]